MRRIECLVLAGFILGCGSAASNGADGAPVPAPGSVPGPGYSPSVPKRDAGSVPVIPAPSDDAGTSVGDDGAVTGITVHGRLLDATGQPLAVALVSVSGRSPIMTDSNGEFAIADVVVPYDLTVVWPKSRSVAAYQGLTRADPTVVSTTRISRTAQLSGTVSGPGFIVIAHDTRLFLGESSLSVVPPDRSFSGAFMWFGPESTVAPLYAFQFARDINTRRIFDYNGYSSIPDVALHDGKTISGVGVVFNVVSSSTIVGTIAPSDGTTVATTELVFNPALGIDVPLESVSSPGTSFSFVVPAVRLGSFTVRATINEGEGAAARTSVRGLAAGATGVVVAIPAPPQLNTPPEGGVVVDDGTAFDWSAPAGAASFLTIMPRTGAGFSYRIFVSGHSAHLPDLGPFGLSIEPGTSAWHASIVQGASVDDFASTKDVVATADSFGVSRPRTFTTK